MVFSLLVFPLIFARAYKNAGRKHQKKTSLEDEELDKQENSKQSE
jgi:hypothetical protein